MKRMNFNKSVLIAILVVVGLAGAAQAGVVIVANGSVPGDSIGASDLKKFFLGKSASWSDGSAVKPAVIKSGPASEEFLKTYVKKSPSQFKTFWKKAVFSGTGTPPKDFATDAELVKFVTSTPGAVGFVAEGTDTSGAKVLTVQ